MTPAVSYMRCSSKGAVFGDTWERQSETIVEFCRRMGFELVREYREEAVPGKFDEDQRPAFQAMITDLLGNGCKIIVVESLDRLAREYRVQESLIIYIASKGLQLYSANTGENITEAMMGDPMRRALVQIQGILAELDKNMIVAKLRKARQRIRGNGKRCEGRKPFGTKDGESPILDRMRELESYGLPAYRIAEKLNESGSKTRYGKPWHEMTVAKILRRAKNSQNVPATRS